MRSWTTLRRVVALLRTNVATLVAGSLAYSAFLSVLPLLTLAAVAATAVGDRRLVEQALRLTGAYVTPTGRALFAEALRNDTRQVAASLVSLLFVVWSALRVFRGLDATFSLFYDTADAQGFVGDLRDALVVSASLAAALLVAVVAGVASTFLVETPLAGLVGTLVLLGPFALAFLPVYYVFPNADVTVREVLPGVLVASVGWTVLQRVFRLYVAYAGEFEVYGTLGAVLLVLTWLYVASLVLLIGVAVNVVLAGRGPAAGPDSRAGRRVPSGE